MTKRLRLGLTVALLGAAVAFALGWWAPARAVVRTVIVVPYGASGYSYKIGVPGHSQGFEAINYDDVFFATGPAPFGRGPAPGRCPLDTTVRTVWPINTDLVVRRSFYLSMETKNLWVHVAIDNDVQVFINGVDISHGLQRTSGCAERDRFTFRARDDILKLGTNVLAVRARDRGVDSYLDIKITADMEWI